MSHPDKLLSREDDLQKGESDRLVRKSLQNVPLLCIAGIFLVLAILNLNSLLLYTPDSARYLIWGNSLASFCGFLDATEVEVARYVVHAPLYSILIAPVLYIFLESRL